MGLFVGSVGLLALRRGGLGNVTVTKQPQDRICICICISVLVLVSVSCRGRNHLVASHSFPDEFLVSLWKFLDGDNILSCFNPMLEAIAIAIAIVIIQ